MERLELQLQKVANYHIGTSHHIQFWDFKTEECNYHHLPKQFN